MEKITWCPEHIDPFGTRTRKGLCTGQDERGPHLDEGPGSGTELKLLELQGLHIGGGNGGGGPCMDNEPGPISPPGPGPDTGGPGPGPWWHIGPPQFGIGHCPTLLIPPMPQYWSTAKLSWLPEHCSRWGNGGDDCLE